MATIYCHIDAETYNDPVVEENSINHKHLSY